MTVAATSIKMPRDLKSRIERLAERSGETTHSFMLRALESQVEAAERYQEFLAEGVQADEAMLRSGLGFAADDVHAYLEAKIGGNRVKRPKPVRWLK